MQISIHQIRNFGPNNINRGDDGMPKQAHLGGINRQRISSQALKRAVRMHDSFRKPFHLGGGESALLSYRTRILPELVRAHLENKLGADSTTCDDIATAVAKMGKKEGADDAKKKKKKNGDDGDTAETLITSQAMFFSLAEVARISKTLLEIYQHEGATAFNKLKIADLEKAASSHASSVDVALFGRMTTSELFQNVEASVQVASAIGVNAYAADFDFFTALDDLEGVAAMLDTKILASSTFYQYYNIYWEQLLANLKGNIALARQVVEQFLLGVTYAIPSGNKNNTAPFFLPDLIFIEVHPDNRPINYGNAFMSPARPNRTQSLAENAIEKLAAHVTQMSEMYNLAPMRCHLCSTDFQVADSQQASGGLNGQIEWLLAALPQE